MQESWPGCGDSEQGTQRAWAPDGGEQAPCQGLGRGPSVPDHHRCPEQEPAVGGFLVLGAGRDDYHKRAGHRGRAQSATSELCMVCQVCKGTWEKA